MISCALYLFSKYRKVGININFKTVVTFIVTILCSLNVLAAEKITIYATNYPLQYFAMRIAGEHAIVELPVPPDVDPAFWSPKAETVALIQTYLTLFKCLLYISNIFFHYCKKITFVNNVSTWIKH